MRRTRRRPRRDVRTGGGSDALRHLPLPVDLHLDDGLAEDTVREHLRTGDFTDWSTGWAGAAVAPPRRLLEEDLGEGGAGDLVALDLRVDDHAHARVGAERRLGRARQEATAREEHADARHGERPR